MHLYIVGEPVLFLEAPWFSAVKVKNFLKEELLPINKEHLRIFKSYEDATNYARSLRIRGSGHLNKEFVSNNKAAPILTIEVDDEFNLGSELSERIRFRMGVNQPYRQVKIHYYHAPAENLKDRIIKAEFPEHTENVLISNNSTKSCSII